MGLTVMGCHRQSLESALSLPGSVCAIDGASLLVVMGAKDSMERRQGLRLGSV